MIQPDEIIRSSRKTLSLTIDPFGRLIVRAPRSCKEERIFQFIQEKERWILRKKAEMQGAGMRLPPENLNGYEFLLLGNLCRICLIEGKNISYDGENKIVYLPERNARIRLIKWLKENAKRIFMQITEEKAKQMQAQFQSVTICNAKSKWGSCSFDNKLRYTFRLIYAPKEVIEYVVIHELAHTKYKNHSPLFWTEVEKYVPDWKEKRKWLKTHGILMKIF